MMDGVGESRGTEVKNFRPHTIIIPIALAGLRLVGALETYNGEKSTSLIIVGRQGRADTLERPI